MRFVLVGFGEDAEATDDEISGAWFAGVGAELVMLFVPRFILGLPPLPLPPDHRANRIIRATGRGLGRAYLFMLVLGLVALAEEENTAGTLLGESPSSSP